MRIVANGLQIRSVVEEDFRDIFRLYRQLVGKNVDGDEFHFSRIFKSFFSDPTREAYVAAVHHQVIGFVTMYYLDVLHRSGKVASIQELVVTAEFRGRGVGQALMEFVKQKAHEKQCQGIEVATDLWQLGAKAFFERCGLRGKTQTIAI